MQGTSWMLEGGELTLLSEVAFLRDGHLDSLGKKSPQCRGKYCLKGSVLGVGNVAQEVSALCQHCIDWVIPALGRWR